MIEARLRALADDAFPPTPDLAAAWAGESVPHPGLPAHRRRWRGIAVVVAALLVPAAAVGALELLGPGDVRIVRVTRLPRLAPAAPPLGERVGTAAEASAHAGFAVRVPASLAGERPTIHVLGEIVTLAYEDVVITEVPTSEENADVLVKTLGPGTEARRVSVRGAPGWFLSGAPHGVAYITPTGRFARLAPRLAGNTLVYQRDGLVIRVEGERLTLERALRTSP